MFGLPVTKEPLIEALPKSTFSTRLRRPLMIGGSAGLIFWVGLVFCYAVLYAFDCCLVCVPFVVFVVSGWGLVCLIL